MVETQDPVEVQLDSKTDIRWPQDSAVDFIL